MTNSTDFEIDDSFDDETSFVDESNAKLTPRESLEKRRAIDELLAERKLERELKEMDLDFDDDDLEDFDDE